jgi:hypothetical protein
MRRDCLWMDAIAYLQHRPRDMMLPLLRTIGLAASIAFGLTAVRPLAAQHDSQSSRPDSTLCVVMNGELVELPMEVDAQTGDTLIGGRTLDEVMLTAPSPYFNMAAWRFEEPMVTIDGRRYVSYGLPRVMPASEMVRVGEYRGLPLFASRRMEDDEDDAVRFLATRPGCEFQLFWYAPYVGSVRGG